MSCDGRSPPLHIAALREFGLAFGGQIIDVDDLRASTMARPITSPRSSGALPLRPLSPSSRVQQRTGCRQTPSTSAITDWAASQSLSARSATGVEDRLHVGRRFADHSQDVGGRRPLLERLLGLVEQPHVLERDTHAPTIVCSSLISLSPNAYSRSKLSTTTTPTTRSAATIFTVSSKASIRFLPRCPRPRPRPPCCGR